MNNLLEINKLNKKFGNNIILENVSFAIKPGEIVGLIGRNGVGKTTLMKSILGLVQIDSGEIIFDGESKFQNNKLKMDEIGYLLDCKLYENMNAYDNIKIQEMYRCKYYNKNEEKKIIEEILEFVDLTNNRKKVKQYSFGMKQRLGLALALLGDKKLLILDEPFVGLDPIGIQVIKEFIVKLCKERKIAVLISSHQLSELENICDKFFVISNKKLIDYDYDEKRKIIIYTKESTNNIFKKDFNELIDFDEKKISFWFEEGLFNSILKILINNNIFIENIEIQKNSLEALFEGEII